MKNKYIPVNFVFQEKSYNISTDTCTAQQIDWYNKICNMDFIPKYTQTFDNLKHRNIQTLKWNNNNFEIVCVKSKIGMIPDNMRIANDLQYSCFIRERNGNTHNIHRGTVAMMIYEILEQRRSR